MTTNAYRQALRQAQSLTPKEQLQLIEELLTMLRQHSNLIDEEEEEEEPLHSILEFEGLGKEVWEGIDVKQYLEQERASWDG
jgi:predicted restriction endonuclease